MVPADYIIGLEKNIPAEVSYRYVYTVYTLYI
jgi:hypothetical protein